MKVEEGTVERRSGSDGTTPAIDLRSVSKFYDMESGERVKAVENVSLTVAPGQFVCVVGPSGHGKSTLLNLIAGFTEPTTGDVFSHGTQCVDPARSRGGVSARHPFPMDVGRGEHRVRSCCPRGSQGQAR